MAKSGIFQKLPQKLELKIFENPYPRKILKYSLQIQCEAPAQEVDLIRIKS